MQRLTETPVLRVQDLTVRYGGGCPHCAGALPEPAAPKPKEA